jgi:uncharacterized membrane protein
MTLLILGLILFAGVHLVPSIAPGAKQAWRSKLGEGGYKGSFSVLLLASFALMIMGWRDAQAAFVYLPSPALKFPALGLLVIAFFMLVISNRPSRLRQLIRHPQLTGVLLWSLAHIVLNGDSRSLVLFGGMAAWSLIEILAINKREGVWIKTEVPGWSKDAISLAITLLVIAVVVALHPYISGMPVH